MCEEIARAENHPGAWSLLGVILGMQGNLGEAEECFRRAIALDHDDISSHYHLGMLLEQCGRHTDAIVSLRTAMQIDPDHLDTQLRLGCALAANLQHQEAAACFRQIIARNPQSAEAHFHLGNALHSLNQLEDAAHCYCQALILAPHLPSANHNLGLVLVDQGKYKEAISCYQAALASTPTDEFSHNQLGRVLFRLGRIDEATEHYRLAIALKPDYPEAHNHLGVAMAISPAMRSEAIGHFRHAIALKPDYAEAYNNLAAAISVDSLDEAVEYYRQALVLKPDFAEAHFNLSLVHLLTGDFEKGWEGHEWRWKCEGAAKPRDFNQPLWDGSDLNGHTILLHAEQGYGDTLQFIRYAPLVQKRGGRVVVECQPPLMRLLRSVAGIDQLVQQNTSLPEFDTHLPLLSLPRVFRTRLDTIPATTSYLALPNNPCDALENVMEACRNKLRVGIVWRGRETHSDDSNRSCPLSCFVDLAGQLDISLFSLQKGPSSLAGTETPADFPIIDISRYSDDFYDTAAATGRLDLIITVDTSVAHLAGALGRPVWVLLPYLPDWRWLLDREDSPWYPSMRLFRQESPGDWNGVFQRVAIALADVA